MKRLSTLAMTLSLSSVSGQLYASSEEVRIQSIQVVELKTERRVVDNAAIDSEKFEVGAYLGTLSVDGFNTNLLFGLSGSYHINNRWLIQFNYGRSDVDESTYEKVVEASFIRDENRVFEFVDILAGYTVLPGRSYFGGKSTINSSIILLAGLGHVNYAGEGNLSVTVGASYRLVLTDFLTFNLDLKDHMVEYEFLGQSSLTHNIEFSLGVNALF